MVVVVQMFKEKKTPTSMTKRENVMNQLSWRACRERERQRDRENPNLNKQKMETKN